MPLAQSLASYLSAQHPNAMKQLGGMKQAVVRLGSWLPLTNLSNGADNYPSSTLPRDQQLGAHETLTELQRKLAQTTDPDARDIYQVLVDNTRTQLNLSIEPSSSSEPGSGVSSHSNSHESSCRGALGPVPSPAPDTQLRAHVNPDRLGPVVRTNPSSKATNLVHVDKESPSLARNIVNWFQTYVGAANSQISLAIERRQQINDTPLSPAYTRLEKLCLFTRRDSVLRWISTSSQVEIQRVLQDSGYEVDPKSGSYGALHLTVISGRENRLRVLLDAGRGKVDINQESKVFKDTALGLAAWQGKRTCAEMLLDAGATMKTDDVMALVWNRDMDLFKTFIHHFLNPRPMGRWDVGTRHDVDFPTVLSCIIEQGSPEMAHYLLQNCPAIGASIGNGSRPSLDQCPLAVAVRKADAGVVTLLLQRRPDRGYVEELTLGLCRWLQNLPSTEQQRYAPVVTELQHWLNPHHASTACAGAIEASPRQDIPRSEARRAQTGPDRVKLLTVLNAADSRRLAFG